jgi:uncharacterized membrane protein
MFIAPLSQPADTIDLGDSGLVHPQLDNEKKYKHIDNYFVRRVYESGDRNCHQRGSRSVYINGNEMPYCTRDMAIFVGMAIGALISLFVFVKIDWKWVVAGLIPMAIDGTTQLITSYESNNILRMATGLPAGMITTLALGGVLFELGLMISRSREEKMALFKAQGKKGPKIPYWLRSVAIASAIILGICGLVAADYAMHDGYREEEVKLALTAEDAPYFTTNTTLLPGEDVVLIQHKDGPNLDWAKLSIIIRWEDRFYNGGVLKINGNDYNRYSNHITEKGDTVIITLVNEELPTLSNISVTLREGSKTIWSSSEDIIIT